MSAHHHAIRRQAIATALGRWSGAMIDSPASPPCEPLEEPQESISEMIFTWGSGSEPFCTISQEKIARSVA